MYKEFVILAFFALLYSLVAGRLERTPITGPIIFLSFGLLTGPLGLGWLELDIDRQELRILADMTLALVLFIDAANANRVVLRTSAAIPLRMLLFGLPMTIALGMVAGMLLFDQLGIWELFILATMLTATDAALGKGVITNKAVPVRIREGLNVESGLNDGICVPLLFIFIILAEAKNVEGQVTSLVLTHLVKEIGIGLVVGLSMTAMAAWLMKWCWERGWITEVWMQLPVIMLAILCFTVAQTLHGSGYIAAFSGGIMFGIRARAAKSDTHELVLSAEGMAETLAMFTWIIFGAVFINKAIEFISWQVVVYAVLSLTVVRMLPIFLSLTGTGEKVQSKLFLGWFGPRGFASIVFAIIVLNTTLPGAHHMAIVVACTVILSALLHGLTANPLASALAARVRNPRTD
jgi:NhaP-type Na+/H+ or K+/H+ antiporter